MCTDPFKRDKPEDVLGELVITEGEEQERCGARRRLILLASGEGGNDRRGGLGRIVATLEGGNEYRMRGLPHEVTATYARNTTETLLSADGWPQHPTIMLHWIWRLQ